MRLLEAVGGFFRRQIDDVVGIGRAVQPRQLPHPIGNRMVSTGCVTTDAQSADDLAA